MTNYSKANEITARECGVQVKYLKDEPTFLAIVDGYNSGLNDSVGLFSGDEWTISDPRCREIIREKFGIETGYSNNGNWTTWTAKDFKNTDVNHSCEGKTIAEAEIATILAIVEELDNER